MPYPDPIVSLKERVERLNQSTGDVNESIRNVLNRSISRNLNNTTPRDKLVDVNRSHLNDSINRMSASLAPGDSQGRDTMDLGLAVGS